MEVPVSAENKQPGKFWQGFLLSLSGWAVDLGIATLIYSLSIYDYKGSFSVFTRLSGVFAIFLAVIWLPVAIIAGYRSWKKGFNAVLPLVLITSIIAPILIGCGFSAFFGIFG
jgi:hypothetical protein